jgi:thiosulfate dehydrogenase (quinone) large subunit
MVASAVSVACGTDYVIVHQTDPDAASDPDTGTDEAAAACQVPGKSVGTVAKFAVGTWTLVGTLVIAQDANGFFAFSGICPHAGCLVDPPASNGSTYCACHGSRFDGNGKVTTGPARTALPHYAVAFCNGVVFVDTKTIVPASTRTPPA